MVTRSVIKHYAYALQFVRYQDIISTIGELSSEIVIKDVI